MSAARRPPPGAQTGRPSRARRGANTPAGWGRALVVLSAWGPLACGGDEAPPVVVTPPEAVVQVVTAAPLPAVMTESSSVALASPAQALGTAQSGAPVVVVGGVLHTVGSDGLVPHALYAEGDDPRAVGVVSALAPRALGGAWIGAEAGLFVLATPYVTHQPLGTPLAPRALSEAVTGPLAGVWLGASSGLYHQDSSRALARYEPASGPLAVRALAVDVEGAAGLVVDEAGGLWLLEAEGDARYLSQPELGAGRTLAVAAGRGVLWAGTEQGLVRWRATDTPRFTRFTLGGSGAEAVRALAAEHDTGVAWARTDTAFVRATPAGELERVVAPALSSGAVPALAVDTVGDVWSTEGSGLLRQSLADRTGRVSFAADVAPWIGQHCAACHQNATADFRDVAVFRARAEASLARVRTGDMPRCDGGRPCAERLAPAAYAVLERWIRQGKPE